LVAAGVIERELIALIHDAGEKKMDICAVLEDPAAAARKLGMHVSKRTIQDLKQLAPSRLEKISDPVSREVLQFFHQVAKDGRFLETWTTRPYEVAKKLKLKISDIALERILAAGSIANTGAGSIIWIVVVIVVIVGVVITRFDIEVRDSSGIEKF
jgi:hypothetical protein